MEKPLIVIASSMIIFLVIVIFALIRNRKVLADKSERLISAKAQIISAAISDVKPWDIVKEDIVKLLLELNIEGKPSSRGTVTWLVKTAEKENIKPGNVVNVKIDPAFPNEIYPEDSWAEYMEEEKKKK